MRNLNAHKIMQVSQILDFKLSSEGVNNLVNLTRVSASNDDTSRGLTNREESEYVCLNPQSW